MDWKEFFRPTIGRLILPMLFLIWVIYGDLFAPLKCAPCPSVFERLVSAITNPGHIVFIIIIMLVLYFVSCSISRFISKFKK